MHSNQMNTCVKFIFKKHVLLYHYSWAYLEQEYAPSLTLTNRFAYPYSIFIFPTLAELGSKFGVFQRQVVTHWTETHIRMTLHFDNYQSFRRICPLHININTTIQIKRAVLTWQVIKTQREDVNFGLPLLNLTFMYRAS